MKLILCLIGVLFLMPIAADALDTEGMSFVRGGCFLMGNVFDEGDEDETAHEVCLDDFYIDTYEVTQREYKRVMGENPSLASMGKCDTCPVDTVSWEDAARYCKRVKKVLPSEAQWEYAARGGGKEHMYAGGNENPGDYGWLDINSQNHTHPVGQKTPNTLGLYDMTGNVWEWVNDWYDEDYYLSSPRQNPPGPKRGKFRVIRGGSWGYYAWNSRTMNRFASRADGPYTKESGFRCAGNKPEQ